MITNSNPSQLKITDIRFADLDGTPKHCPLIKIYTNQGIVGYGEVRDASSKTYAAMLKSRLVGENPCNVEKLIRRIRQFGHHSRQGGGVSGVEVALWDLAGKAYGVPVYNLLVKVQGSGAHLLRYGRGRAAQWCRHGPGTESADGYGFHIS